MSRTQLQLALFAFEIWTLLLQTFISVRVRCLLRRSPGMPSRIWEAISVLTVGAGTMFLMDIFNLEFTSLSMPTQSGALTSLISSKGAVDSRVAWTRQSPYSCQTCLLCRTNRGRMIQRCKERTWLRDKSMYKFQRSTFSQVAATARSFFDLAPFHEDVAASIRPTVAAAAVSGTSVRCSCRNFGTSIITVMLSFQVVRLSCTYYQGNSEVFPFRMQGRSSHDVSVVMCK